MAVADPAETLIPLLLSLAEREGIKIGKTKLVKLLYLLEVEFYREHHERLTSLTWVFLHYGPYPLGLDDLLESPDVEVLPKRLTDGRSFQQVTVADAPRVISGPDPAVELLARRIFLEWGGLELNRLLNYVYFETEPMMRAVRGEELDFSTVIPREPALKIVVDGKKLARIRKNLGEHLERFQLSKAGCNWNPILAEGLKLWDEGRRQVDIRGSVEFDPSGFGQGAVE
jgi:hypothetical protein